VGLILSKEISLLVVDTVEVIITRDALED
jgi:hypothetical protein